MKFPVKPERFLGIYRNFVYNLCGVPGDRTMWEVFPTASEPDHGFGSGAMNYEIMNIEIVNKEFKE